MRPSFIFSGGLSRSDSPNSTTDGPPFADAAATDDDDGNAKSDFPGGPPVILKGAFTPVVDVPGGPPIAKDFAAGGGGPAVIANGCAAFACAAACAANAAAAASSAGDVT